MKFADETLIPSIKPMTKEKWDEIVQCKEDFLSGKIDDPRKCSCIDPVVAASWLRSKQAGVDPNLPIYATPYTFPDDDMKIKTIISYSEFEEIAKPFLDTFSKWTTVFGNELKREGDGTYLILSINDLELGIIQAQGRRPVPEEAFGTTIFTIVQELNRPAILHGVENYCYGYHDIFSSAAPIFDPNGNTISILYLGVKLPRYPWEQEMQIIYSQLLALVSTMAVALENKLHLLTAYKTIQSANDLLNTTLSLIDEGIISVDCKGEITGINKSGSYFLQLPADQINGRNINEFLSKATDLKRIISAGESTNIEEIICVDNNCQPYLINVRPLLNKDTLKSEGAVLRLNSSEKVNQQATARTGLRATFTFANIVGESVSIRQAIQTSVRWAKSSENVLLIGESGTGKELFAQAIHNQFNSKKPFVAINCAAIPKELIESELFGYDKGSFTGADRNGRPGKIELAHNGTLFLDEIGDMPLDLQAVLLRVLEDKQVMRIGGTYSKAVDFRLIAATNQNLKTLVQEKRFRSDLYYRLSVLAITIPPLRERENDLLLLSSYFLDKYSQKTCRVTPKLSSQAADILTSYTWPGNVRQLENAIIYCINTIQEDMILPEHLPEDIRGRTTHPSLSRKDHSPTESISALTGGLWSLKDVEAIAIQHALEQNENNMTKTATQLDISKTTLYKKAKEYGLLPGEA